MYQYIVDRRSSVQNMHYLHIILTCLIVKRNIYVYVNNIFCSSGLKAQNSEFFWVASVRRCNLCFSISALHWAYHEIKMYGWKLWQILSPHTCRLLWELETLVRLSVSSARCRVESWWLCEVARLSSWQSGATARTAASCPPPGTVTGMINKDDTSTESSMMMLNLAKKFQWNSAVFSMLTIFCNAYKNMLLSRRSQMVTKITSRSLTYR